MSYRHIALLAVLITAACTRSPLTDRSIILGGAAHGDVPRDANGEPIMTRIKPVPPEAIVTPPPAPAPPR